MILLFGLYLLVGLIAIFSAGVIHLIRAERKGYDAINWWNEHNIIAEADYLVLRLIFGTIIWPVRLAQFIMDLPEYYGMYDLKD